MDGRRCWLGRLLVEAWWSDLSKSRGKVGMDIIVRRGSLLHGREARQEKRRASAGRNRDEWNGGATGDCRQTEQQNPRLEVHTTMEICGAHGKTEGGLRGGRQGRRDGHGRARAAVAVAVRVGRR